MIRFLLSLSLSFSCFSLFAFTESQETMIVNFLRNISGDASGIATYLNDGTSGTSALYSFYGDSVADLTDYVKQYLYSLDIYLRDSSLSSVYEYLSQTDNNYQSQLVDSLDSTSTLVSDLKTLLSNFITAYNNNYSSLYLEAIKEQVALIYNKIGSGSSFPSNITCNCQCSNSSALINAISNINYCVGVITSVVQDDSSSGEGSGGGGCDCPDYTTALDNLYNLQYFPMRQMSQRTYHLDSLYYYKWQGNNNNQKSGDLTLFEGDSGLDFFTLINDYMNMDLKTKEVIINNISHIAKKLSNTTNGADIINEFNSNTSSLSSSSDSVKDTFSGYKDSYSSQFSFSSIKNILGLEQFSGFTEYDCPTSINFSGLAAYSFIPGLSASSLSFNIDISGLSSYFSLCHSFTSFVYWALSAFIVFVALRFIYTSIGGWLKDHLIPAFKIALGS